MGNPSAEKLGLFNRVFNLIDPSDATKAGYKAVGKGLKKQHDKFDDISKAYKSYVTGAGKDAQRKQAIEALRKNGFRPNNKSSISDQIDAFHIAKKDKLPNLKKFDRNPSNYIESNPSTIPNFVAGATKDYFTNGTKGQLAARYGAVAAGYAGVSTASRYLTGGTATRDSYGNKDIAGIPFV